MQPFDWIQKIITRGDKAAAMIDNTAYQEAVLETRQDYINLWINSPADDAKVRERAYLGVRILADVDLKLRKYVDDGRYEVLKEQMESSPQNGVH